MISPKETRLVLEPRPSFSFENEGVLNPACIEKDGIVHMFYRAVETGNYSTIGYCQLKDHQVIYRSEKPIITREFPYESHGVEDPRITYLEGKYYLFYTAYNGQSATVAYATSPDLKKFTKHGLITPQISYDLAEDIFKQSGVSEKYSFFEQVFKQNRGSDVHLWEKDVALFPQKFNGQYALIHRILPGIQILYFDKFSDLTDDFWLNYLKQLNHHVILEPLYNFENAYIGGGCTPVLTEAGWLLIYHSTQDSPNGQIYHASAALLDRDNPKKVIGRLSYPLFSPERKWEKLGTVDNVVFPTSVIINGDNLSIYYGAADFVIGLKIFSLSELLQQLLNSDQKQT